ncbi:MAG: uroporphyrinogen-III synthase [Deinococcales bacterium]
MAEALAQHGFRVLHQPLIATKPILSEKVKIAALELLTAELLVLTSPSCLKAWEALGIMLVGPKLATIGEKTAERLRLKGLEVSLTGEAQNAKSLTEAFLELEPLPKSVAIAKSDRGLDILESSLSQAGIEVKSLIIYQTILKRPDLNLKPDVMVLASPSAVEALAKAYQAKDLTEIKFIAIGKTTSQNLASLGFNHDISPSPNTAGILEAVLNSISQKDVAIKTFL